MSGFALAGAPGFSLSASLFALAGFLIGAYGGGVAIGRHGDNRAVLFREGSVVELAFLLAALIISALASTPFDGAVKDAIAITAAIALGLQNAVVRRLAVPDLTTTVLTMTLTGIAADVRAAHFGRGRSTLAGRGDDVGRGGGGCRCWSCTSARPPPSALATGLMAVVAASAILAARRPAAWQA